MTDNCEHTGRKKERMQARERPSVFVDGYYYSNYKYSEDNLRQILFILWPPTPLLRSSSVNKETARGRTITRTQNYTWPPGTKNTIGAVWRHFIVVVVAVAVAAIGIGVRRRLVLRDRPGRPPRPSWRIDGWGWFLCRFFSKRCLCAWILLYFRILCDFSFLCAHV